MRIIHLPAIGKAIPLASYIKAIKTAKAHPTEEFKTGLSSWWPTTGQEIMKQFMEGVEDRINQAVPYNHRKRLTTMKET